MLAVENNDTRVCTISGNTTLNQNEHKHCGTVYRMTEETKKEASTSITMGWCRDHIRQHTVCTSLVCHQRYY